MYPYLAFAAFLYLFSYLIYVNLSHGLGHKAEYLQLRRFFPCAVLAVLPMYLTQLPLNSYPYMTSLFVGFSWIITFPLLYFLTYHKNSSDFGFHLDTVFGLYIIGWLISLKICAYYFNYLPVVFIFIISTIEFMLLIILLFQIIYYFIYKTCINDSAIALIRETDNNEALEFFKSLPLIVKLISPLCLVLLAFGIYYCNNSPLIIDSLPTYNLYTLIAILIFLTMYLWNTKKGVFIRTGIVELFLDVSKYIQETKRYTHELNTRLKNLQVKSQNEFANKPTTIILVVGESESRDYMSAFCKCEYNTTPWLSEFNSSPNCLLFKNAYACKDQTVPVLEHALTEANQYNAKKFYESCSIIDIAKKAGYKTYWFSNQGHIGSAETAITLIANTADKAEWTKQNLNQFQYDESLIDYLKTVDSTENNFIILHLMGSHFNFINRYPQSCAHFSKPNKYDLIPNYLDSIAYTDSLLNRIIKYAKDNLNLNALVYFSDHATIPDKRRSPNFGGFATVRIPLFIFLSNNYITNHSNVYTALKENQDKYWTNDLLYDLMCGIFDIKSNHFDEENSLTSFSYKYRKEDLKTNLGSLSIKDDK